MTFYRGQKVTMKENSPFGVMHDSERQPEYGKVYTIRDLVMHREILLGLRFEEIRNPRILRAFQEYECHFQADCFRPVVTRKTDISIFTRMLDQTKVHAQ